MAFSKFGAQKRIGFNDRTVSEYLGPVKLIDPDRGVEMLLKRQADLEQLKTFVPRTAQSDRPETRTIKPNRFTGRLIPYESLGAGALAGAEIRDGKVIVNNRVVAEFRRHLANESAIELQPETTAPEVPPAPPTVAAPLSTASELGGVGIAAFSAVSPEELR